MLFFRPPDALFQLRGYRATGVQLFRDYVRAFDIVDPWRVSEYRTLTLTLILTQ